MLILGLDPGSLCTGYGLIEVRRGAMLWRASGTLRPPRGEALPARLLALQNGLRELLRETRPQAMSIEDSFVGRNSRAALVLGEARGVLTVTALSEGVPLFEYAPRLVKLSVTGSGGASKEQVHRMVGHLIERVPRDLPLDVTDALALAVCHAHRCAQPPDAPRSADGRTGDGGGAQSRRRARARSQGGARDAFSTAREWSGSLPRAAGGTRLRETR